MSKKANIITGVSIVAIVIIVAMFMMGNSNKMDGSYISDMGGSKFELKFKGNTVTKVETDKKSDQGTYEIEDGKLTMKFDDYTMKASLDKDKKTFTLNSVTGSQMMGFGFLLEGLKFEQVAK